MNSNQIELECSGRARLVEKKRLAFEARQKTLVEKNHLAEENERIRNERKTEFRLRRSEKDMVESRKIKKRKNATRSSGRSGIEDNLKCFKI